MKKNVVITALVVSISFAATTHGAALRTVALSGQSAPGTTTGVTFETFGALVHTQEQWDYGGAVLNDAGQIAFRANLTGSGVDSTNNQGVWSEGSGGLSLVARTGSQAPGVASGVNFRGDAALELFSPVLNNAGQTAFYGATTDGGLGFWSEGSGSLAPVARSGEQAAGTPSGVNFTFANLYEYLESPLINDAGQTSFRSYLDGAGVNSGNNFGLWSEGSGSLQLVARLGSQATGLPTGVNHGGMYEAGLNDAGQAVFFSFLTGSGVNNSNNRSLWSEVSDSLALVARSGSQAPGLPSGVNFNNFTNTGAINNAGQIALVAGLSSETSQWGQNSLWLFDSGGMTLLARRGTQAPGTPAGVTYEDFGGWAALNDAGQTLFTALLTGSGVDASNELALYLSDAVGNQTLVSRKGDQAPGTPTSTLFVGTPDDAFGPALNNAGQVALTSHLAGAGVDSTNDFGIWATDKFGVLQLIVRKGDELEVAPGNLRTISDLKFVGAAVGSSNGWPSGFSNVGQVAFWASFTDGSQGVFVSNKVATVPGDFNFDGTVDAADYVEWREGLGSLYTQSHYNIWRANFGASLGNGSAASSFAERNATIPEPATALLLVFAMAISYRRTRGGAARDIRHWSLPALLKPARLLSCRRGLRPR